MTIKHALPMEHYHKDPAYSKTDIVHARRSTQYVIDMRLDPPNQTAAQAVGSAVHLHLLEPEKVDDDIVYIGAGIRRGKVYDEALKAFPDKIILLENEAEQIELMVESAKQNGFGKSNLGKGPAELSILQKINIDGYELPVKCRPDLLPGYTVGGLAVVDIKTARDITPEEFGKAAFNFHYHWSAWLTRKILELETKQTHEYYFLAIENKKPFETVAYQVMPWDYEAAEEQIMPVLSKLAHAHATKEFKEIEPKGVLPLQMPRWAFRRAA